MTHGDKSKAKAGKSSQASARKGGKAVAAREAGKSVKASKAGKKSGQAAAKEQSSAAKGSNSAKSSPKGAVETAAKVTRGSETGNGTFANPLVAAAFKRAVKKYPNAFRKLTD